MVNINERENIIFLTSLLKTTKTFTPPYHLLFRSSKDLLVEKFPQHTSEQLILRKYVFPGCRPVTMMLFEVFV